LGFVGSVKTLDRLQFNKNGTINHQVCLELADILTSKINRHGNFSSHRDPGFGESEKHTIAAHGFQKTMTDLVVDIVINAENLFGEFGMQQF
jgi:hypothetical protein